MRPAPTDTANAIARIEASLEYGVLTKDDIRTVISAARAVTDEEIAEAWCRYLGHTETQCCDSSLRLVKTSERLSFRDGIRHFLGRITG